MAVIDQIIDLIEQRTSFILEAGAGSGKTYTLIQTINYLIEKKGKELKLNNQKIVCITYTNVAKNEIIDRLENNPLVIVSTIHEFLWSCIKPYNRQLLFEIDRLNTIMFDKKPDKYKLGLIERISEVIYNDSSYRDFEKGQLHHDDVIIIAKQMFANYALLTTILADKFPFILIDEYQDTAIETTEALIDSLLERNKNKVLLGFYGDSYQKIYDTGVGSLQSYIDSGKIALVTKEDNYRSSENVIKLLNNIRKNITQSSPVDAIKISGDVTFINCDNYPPIPKKGITDYEKSLIPQKNLNYDKVISLLIAKGWDFGEGSDDKILIIANSRVAERAEFGDLYRIFSARYGEGANDALLKRENLFASYFTGSVDKKTSKERETGIEHLVLFWLNGDFNSVMRFLKKNSLSEIDDYCYLRSHNDKKIIAEKIKRLIQLRETGSVKQVFDYVLDSKLVLLPKKIKDFQNKIAVKIDEITDEELKLKIEKDFNFYNSLMNTPYFQFINLFKHTQNQTVFSTKHGTKGEEYRNVLMIIDDTSWKTNYNFQKFIDDTEDNEARRLRTQNLFYVSCSRAKEKLVILSLSEMYEPAMRKVNDWFKNGSVYSINDIS